MVLVGSKEHEMDEESWDNEEDQDMGCQRADELGV
jgi:hypothetical protein